MSYPWVYDAGMRKSKPVNRAAAKTGVKTQAARIDINDFDLFALGAETVEHISVPGFMARIAHGWALDDMTRFGDKVGRVAEAMQLVFITTNQTKLGIIRVFPLPLLQRVYEILSPQFGWPRILDAEHALEDGHAALRDELRRHERADEDLSSLVERTDEVETLTSIQTVRDHLAKEMLRLRAELSGLVASPSGT